MLYYVYTKCLDDSALSHSKRCVLFVSNAHRNSCLSITIFYYIPCNMQNFPVPSEKNTYKHVIFD
jgi:hypothetical protein